MIAGKKIFKALVKLAIPMLITGSLLTACSSKNVTYKDGTYTGQSSVYKSDDGEDQGNGYGVAEITIEGGVITGCTYLTYEEDGTLKDEDYGKESSGTVANKDYYNKAQKANAARDQYAAMLVANGSLDGIDAISGATINYNEFVEAVENALSQAEE